MSATAIQASQANPVDVTSDIRAQLDAQSTERKARLGLVSEIQKALLQSKKGDWTRALSLTKAQVRVLVADWQVIGADPSIVIRRLRRSMLGSDPSIWINEFIYCALTMAREAVFQGKPYNEAWDAVSEEIKAKAITLKLWDGRSRNLKPGGSDHPEISALDEKQDALEHPMIESTLKSWGEPKLARYYAKHRELIKDLAGEGQRYLFADHPAWVRREWIDTLSGHTVRDSVKLTEAGEFAERNERVIALWDDPRMAHGMLGLKPEHVGDEDFTWIREHATCIPIRPNYYRGYVLRTDTDMATVIPGSEALPGMLVLAITPEWPDKIYWADVATNDAGETVLVTGGNKGAHPLAECEVFGFLNGIISHVPGESWHMTYSSKPLRFFHAAEPRSEEETNLGGLKVKANDLPMAASAEVSADAN